jgi:signal transduction histidine kinase
MLRNFTRRLCISALILSSSLATGPWGNSLAQAQANRSAITNIRQLTEALSLERRMIRDVHLEVTVCAASRPKVGVLIVRDETGTELLQIGNLEREIFPGERISIQGRGCLLRQREMGIEMLSGMVVDNDGLHMRRTWGGAANLKKGPIPVRLDWFNSMRELNLETFQFASNELPLNIESSNLFHAVVDDSGQTNLLPGLIAECYEGYWEAAPDFDLWKPAKTGIVTNFDIGFRTRQEAVAIRFTGFISIPRDGRYVFRVRSDDGSLFFLGKPELPCASIGRTNVPIPEPGVFSQTMNGLTERRWVEVEGRIRFAAEMGEGVGFDLSSDSDVISVRVADAQGLEPSRLLNARVKIRGVGRGILTTDQRIVLGRISVASANGIVFEEEAGDGASTLITTAGQVQNLPIEDARRSLPVRIRGVVTDAKNSAYDHWMSLQDETRGIFVSLRAVATNGFPSFKEFWEVDGHTGAGDFAPVIVAEKITFLGNGRLPEPARPTWMELLNGSMDVQWAELQGLVTDVQSNKMTLLLPEGRLDVLLERRYESELKPFEKTVVRIRGVLFAVWNPETREVRMGSVIMRNATISVDAYAPADLFDAVVKSPRELLLFDARATGFRRVKVLGQITYADSTQLFLQQDGSGLRLLPTEKSSVRPGDCVEVVGYPDIGRAALLLREVVLRKTGEAPLPEPKRLLGSELNLEGLDSTRVQVRGQLLGWHTEQATSVLEMQSGAHLFFARLTDGEFRKLSSLRPGSRLALEGVYVGRSRNHSSNTETESFEILLGSSANVVVLSQPSWWTLQRLLVLVGILLVVLTFTAIWISQLRRLVGQRTTQLQLEIRERERVERQHALEAERSRIARDLHDDLGSSLTEISVLASTGLRHDEMPAVSQTDFHPASAVSGHNRLFHVIAGKARSLIAALDVIVWAVDPEDNSLQSLADYLTGYTGEFFSHTKVACRFKVPVLFPETLLEGRVRHDLLMAVKETLNNIVRHADATEVEFRMTFSNDILEIDIADNGRGFENGAEMEGHGLKNLSARLAKLGGHCRVDSHVGKGTTVGIRLPLLQPTRA